VKIVTHRVHPNEPCHGLFDRPEGTRWVESVWVIRGDAIAEYRTTIGPSKDFKDVPPLLLPGMGECSVAEYQAEAERHRHDDKWIKRAKEMLAESTLISDILRQEETLLDVVRNRSRFGPGLSVQHNEFPREEVKVRSKEKRSAKRSRARRENP